MAVVLYICSSHFLSCQGLIHDVTYDNDDATVTYLLSYDLRTWDLRVILEPIINDSNKYLTI